MKSFLFVSHPIGADNKGPCTRQTSLHEMAVTLMTHTKKESKKEKLNEEKSTLLVRLRRCHSHFSSDAKKNHRP